MAMSSMPPPARPYRLNVHVLPADASNNLSIEPTRRFLVVTPQTKTLQELCNDISLRHSRNYGGPLNIKKCQAASGSDLDLEYRVCDVFEDQDVIRIIEAPVPSAFVREDSLFPESNLRPKYMNGAGQKRARSSSVRPSSRDRHGDEQGQGQKRGRSSSARPSNRHGYGDEQAPNKRQRTHDPDQPIRSLERDIEDDETTLVNGVTSPSLQVRDSQRMSVPTEDRGQMGGTLDVRYSTGYDRSISPESSSYPRLRPFWEIERSETDYPSQSTPQNIGNVFSQSSFGSPFNALSAANVPGRVPTPGRARSGSETSSHHGDDTSSRIGASHKRRSGSARHNLPVETAVGRGSSVSTAATTPLDSFIPDTPKKKGKSKSKRQDSVTRRSVSIGRNSGERHARVDVYDDIEMTDAETPSRLLAKASSARKIREKREREEAEEKRRLAEQEKLENQRARDEEEAARQREEEAEAAAQKEREAADAKRLEEERLAEEEQLKTRNANEEKRKQLERERQAEEKKKQEAEKKRIAEQKAEQKRQKDEEKERKRTEKAAKAALKEGEKVAKATKLVEEQRQASESTPDSETSKSSMNRAADKTIGPSGFPPCGTHGDIWTPERDDILVDARNSGEEFAAIRKNYFPDITKTNVVTKRYGTVTAFREKFLQRTGQQATQSPSKTEPLPTPATPASKLPRESSTAPIPSNGKTIASLPAAASSQAVATSSPHHPSDVTIDSQVPLSAKRRVSFADDDAPTSGQKPSGRKALPIPEKQTPVPPPKPVHEYKESPIPIPKSTFSSTPDSSSLKQTTLVSPRLGITDVKAKAIATSKQTPSKLTPKPAISTSMKKYSLKNQSRLIPNANISNKISKTQPDSGAKAENGRNKRPSVSQREVAPEESGSDDESSDEEMSDQSGKGQKPTEKKDSGTTQRSPASPVLTTVPDRTGSVARQSRSLSRGLSRDSRSPVAFMSQRASPTISGTKSKGRADSAEIPGSSPSSSPPLVQDQKASDDVDADDQSTESSEDELDEMDVDEAPSDDQLPNANLTEQQLMDDQIQSQIRRDSSQVESRSKSSSVPPPRPNNRVLHSSQFPSLVAMSQAQPKNQLGYGSVDDLQPAKNPKSEEEEEAGSEEESEEESSSSGSSSDSDNDVDQQKKARRAGAEIGGKAKKERSLFGSVVTQINRAKKQ